jgi:hypothetical protein
MEHFIRLGETASHSATVIAAEKLSGAQSPFTAWNADKACQLGAHPSLDRPPSSAWPNRSPQEHTPCSGMGSPAHVATLDPHTAWKGGAAQHAGYRHPMQAEPVLPVPPVTQGVAPYAAASLSLRHHSCHVDAPSAVAEGDASATTKLKRPGLSLACLEAAAQRAATFVVRGQ